LYKQSQLGELGFVGLLGKIITFFIMKLNNYLKFEMKNYTKVLLKIIPHKNAGVIPKANFNLADG